MREAGERMTDSEREAYLERVAICEIDGNCTRAQAERIAMEQVMRERRAADWREVVGER